MTISPRTLIGSGHKTALPALPVLAVGLILNLMYPAWFSVGGPPRALWWLSMTLLALGVVNWAWSAALVLRKVPRGELITTGPFRVVRHPLYTGYALLVLPWLGFLLNSWLGIPVGLALYLGARLYGREEEAALAKTFGSAWEEYGRRVLLPWL